MTDLALASEFPAATRETWLKLVDGVLKGADFDKRLVGKTYDGLAVQPLAARKADAASLGRASTGPWTISQRIDLPDAAKANAQALDDLMSGAHALTLVFADSPLAHGFGLKSAARDTLTRVLGQIHLDMGVTLDLDVGGQSKDAGLVIGEIAKAKGLTPGQIDVKFGYNPIGRFAAGLSSADAWAEIAPKLTAAVQDHIKAGYKGPFVVADGRIIHAAGGTEAQELAFVLVSAVTYLRALEAGGMSLDAARAALYVRLTSDADQFLTIAKFRALRALWARVEDACGLTPKPLFVVAESAWRMQTRNDPQVNMLRNTVAVFAAAIGGADLISVLPHTAALGLPDGAARRVARNTQVVLSEEANLYRVIDPAAGAGAVEDLTAKLIDKAWALFQQIEAAGGIIADLQAGRLLASVAEVRNARLKAVSNRKDPLTGASEFPDVAEKLPDVLAPLPPGTETGNGFALMRLAEPFEALRDAADKVAAKGQRPAVFMANLGGVADFTARTIFAKNFFEAGGLRALSNDGFASLDALVAACTASGAKIACLCSSDAVYAAEAAAAAAALKAAGVTVYLAGRPGELEAALKDAGVSQFVYVGCDVVATLTGAHRLLGIN